MYKNFRRFWFLWSASLLTGLILCNLDSSFEPQKPAFIHFLDRHWNAFKQSLQRKYLSADLQPSSQISLLHLHYSNRVDFWFDDETRKNLGEKLSHYPGPVILNLDPLQLERDAYLQKILQNPKVIRPFRLDPQWPGPEEIEESAARFIQQSNPSGTAARRRLNPERLSYYADPFRFGYTGFSTDMHSHFVYEYQLTSPGMRLQLPSVVLTAISELENCPVWTASAGALECKEKSKILPNPLPLFFYETSVQKLQSVKSIQDSQNVLIVDITDASTFISTFAESKSTWGQLIGTALSNILKNDFPKRTKVTAWGEFLLSLLGILLILNASLSKKLKGTFTAILTVWVAAVAIDLAATLFFNIRTQPIEEYFALFLLSAVGFTTRSILDFEERGLLSKALSGYVSESRLARLLSGEEKLMLEGRREELTTLLLDIAGFSKVTAPLSPERTFSFIHDFFATVDPVILEYGGTIDKKTGDGLLAFFGDELPHPPAPTEVAVRAVKAALEIQKRLKEHPTSPKVECRIGINTGLMMIGNAGSQRHFNYTVIGEAVNLTERLETACVPGEILVGTTTAQYIEKQFELEKIEISIKHEELKVTAYKVKGSKA